MNKQELIKIMESLVMRYSNEGKCPNITAFNAYSDALGWIKKLNEPQVTDEQAWNKIAEAYPESAQSLRNTLDNAVFGKSSEPQKPVVSKFVAEWYEKNKNDLHDKLFCEIATAGNVNEETTEFQHWLFNTSNCMNIVLNMKNGYEVEKEPKWRVYNPDSDEEWRDYLARFIGDNLEPVWRHLGEENPLIFTNKERADAVAVIVNGKVEEVQNGK